MLPTVEQVLDRFILDQEKGELYWRDASKYHREKNGKLAGGATPGRGNKYYWVISLNGKKYRRAQLVFLYVNGYFPRPTVDHINGNSLDDRPSNLRQATITENCWNHHKRTRRINLPMGVRLNASSGRYAARISYLKQQIALGTFDTPEEAREVYLLKRKELYGEFS